VAQEVLPWDADTVVMHGAVPEGGSLRSALLTGAQAMFPSVREQLYAAVASVYEYRVDMSHDLQPGDSVHALLERARGPDSTMRVRRVLATRLSVGGKPIEAYHFPVESGGKTRTRYFDATGRSLATAFLRAPIEFSRISSSFGSRFHPILKIRRMHSGTDYAAVSGTPIRAIADGRVLRAIYNPGGYGNMVEIQHPNGLVSRYAHMRAFATGVRSGTHVDQGQTIGYVGMTGLATAPHLHFEILVGGKQTNPARALQSADGTPIASEYRSQFDQVKGLLAGLLGRPAGIVRLAAAQQAAQ
jgi:murein DD-endopeptidase MepM/ murein hydrolase activator NlpD